MKLSLRYILLAFSVILCVSCVDQMNDRDSTGKEGEYVLDLAVNCLKPGTKADPELWPGIDKYNENEVAYVDWYIFRSADDTGEALLHDRATVTQEEGQTEGLKVTELDMGQYVSDTQKSFYVYTIANMPELEHAEMPVKLADLQALSLTAGFNNETFTAQTSFVMSAGQGFTFTQPGLLTVTNKLSRRASKVSINMNVIPAIDQFTIESDGTWSYVRTWYPELASVQAYLSFANAETTVAAAPATYDQDKFFTYYRTGFKPAFNYTGGPEAYSEAVPTTTPVWSNDAWRWKVQGSPFYSYPMQWTVDSPQAPFLKVILKWTAYKETVDEVTVDGETKLVPRREKSQLDPIEEHRNKEFFYKVPLPGTVLNANDWYDLTFNISILGSTADELPVELVGQYCVMNWSDPDIHAGGELKQGRYLSVASDTYYMYGVDDIEIPVVSSHALETGAAVVTSREVRYKGSWVTTGDSDTPYQVRNLSSRSLSVTAPGDGRSVLKFENPLNTDLDEDLDCYQMRFTLQVMHNDGAGPAPKTITIYQYPPIYVESKAGGNAMVDGYYGNVNGHFHGTGTGNNPGGDSGTSDSSGSLTQTPYAPIGNYANRQKTMTVITISSFGANSRYTLPNGGGTFDYLIADPRVPSGFTRNSLAAHFKGEYNQSNTGTRLVNWKDEEASGVKVGSTVTPNFIAPRFMVSSRWGKMGNWTNPQDRFNTVQKRCATYQEAGYPAGRWRLPTEAEIMFIAKLQGEGFIDELYTSTGHSISATGSVFTVSGKNVSYSDNINDGNSCRCVYDLWYWGEEPAEGAYSTYTISVE